MKQTYFNYHKELRGQEVYKKGKIVPKFIPFHLGITSDDILYERYGYSCKFKQI